MKNVKTLLASVVLLAVVLISSTTSNAGILMTDLTEGDKEPCTQTIEKDKPDWGIVITGFTGIVITGFTGIVITGATDTTEDCGIVITG
jgi:hypothetical protein